MGYLLPDGFYHMKSIQLMDRSCIIFIMYPAAAITIEYPDTDLFRIINRLDLCLPLLMECLTSFDAGQNCFSGKSAAISCLILPLHPPDIARCTKKDILIYCVTGGGYPLMSQESRG